MTKLEKIIYDASYEYERKVFDKGTLSDERERAKIIAAAVLPLIDKSFDAGRNRQYADEFGMVPNMQPTKEQYLSELSGNTEQLKEPKTTKV